MKENDKIIKGYQDIDQYRASMIELAKKTYGLDFEDWYQLGLWKDNYIPYSVIDGEQVVANVSVSPMQFLHKGQTWSVIQLGTVMTEESYRKQGLSRLLIEEILKEFKDKVDGVFLYANDTVVTFYPKFGFIEAKEYQYSKKVKIDTEKTASQFLIKDDESRSRLTKAMGESVPQSDLWLSNQIELRMFYVTSFMQENVYYVEEQDAYVIAEVEENTLILQEIFSTKEVELNSIIEAFGKEITDVTLCFTPLHKDGYQKDVKVIEDSTFFVMGDCFKQMELNGLCIQDLAHA